MSISIGLNHVISALQFPQVGMGVTVGKHGLLYEDKQVGDEHALKFASAPTLYGTGGVGADTGIQVLEKAATVTTVYAGKGVRIAHDGSLSNSSMSTAQLVLFLMLMAATAIDV